MPERTPLTQRIFSGTKWVQWHAEGDPSRQHDGFLCDYHFRVAAACRMIEAYGLGQATGAEREFFFCTAR